MKTGPDWVGLKSLKNLSGFGHTRVFEVTVTKAPIEIKTVWHNMIVIFAELQKTRHNKLHI